MDDEPKWTWVHYKVLALSSDCTNLPELLSEHRFIGFPDGDSRIPESTREETEPAVLDLIEAGALDLFDGGDRLSVESALEVARADSSWTLDGRGACVEVVGNARSGEFANARPTELNPRVPC